MFPLSPLWPLLPSMATQDTKMPTTWPLAVPAPPLFLRWLAKFYYKDVYHIYLYRSTAEIWIWPALSSPTTFQAWSRSLTFLCGQTMNISTLLTTRIMEIVLWTLEILMVHGHLSLTSSDGIYKLGWLMILLLTMLQGRSRSRINHLLLQPPTQVNIPLFSNCNSNNIATTSTIHCHNIIDTFHISVTDNDISVQIHIHHMQNSSLVLNSASPFCCPKHFFIQAMAMGNKLENYLTNIS